jgi:imidazolonepropionase-like amidohydrolase
MHLRLSPSVVLRWSSGRWVVGLAAMSTALMAAHAQAPTRRAPVPGSPAGVTAFVDVTVVPMDKERVLPSHTVLVEGGWITALGPASQVPVPAGAVRVDGRGKYLIPGLADMHGHLSSGDAWDEYRLLQYVAEGVTTLRTLDHQDAAGPAGYQFLRLRARAAAGEIVGPHLYVAAAWYTAAERRSGSTGRYPAPAEVARFVAAYQAAGFDFIKPYFESPIVFDSMLAVARRVGIPVGGHVPRKVPLERALAGGMRSIEHLTGYHIYLTARLPEAKRLQGPSDSTSPAIRQRQLAEARSKIPEIAAATKRAGVWNTPTLALTEFRTRDDSPASGADGFMDVETARLLVKALQDSGAALLLGTDRGSGTNCCAPIVLQDELEALMRAGLTPYQVLLTGTRNVAQYFGTLDSSGTVAVGKRADLVLLNGNPLQDIRHTREPAGVMLGGRWLGRAALDQRLLASTKAWIRSLNLRYDADGRSAAREQMQMLEVLTDSLAIAKPPASERVRQRLAAELGAMRAILRPEQYETFDVLVRVWLREQARRGYQVTVPGVAPAP